MCAVGYDNLPVNFEQVLSLPFREATGVATDPTQDIARPHHSAALAGAGIGWAQHAVSNLTYLTVAGTPDYITIPIAGVVTPVDMNFATGFVTGGFTLAIWAYSTDVALPLPGVQNLFCYGEATVGTGYEVNILADGTIQFITWNAGPASQITDTAAACFDVLTWWFIVVTCDGNWDTGAALIYRNAIDVTDTAGVHISPVSAAARDFLILAHDDGTAIPANPELGFIGRGWNPRVWTRVLPQIEIWELFEMERALFQV